MKTTLTIGWKEVQQEIDLRNFYMGEAIKRREADGDIMQSCSDDKELLVSFANMACNGLITAAALRSHIINFGIDNNNITIMFEADDDCHELLLPRIQKSITDFLVNEIIIQWLLLRKPQMAQTYIYMRDGLCNNAIKLIAKMCNPQRIHRRATDLGGI